MMGHIDPWQIIFAIITFASGAVVLISVADMRR